MNTPSFDHLAADQRASQQTRAAQNRELLKVLSDDVQRAQFLTWVNNKGGHFDFFSRAPQPDLGSLDGDCQPWRRSSMNHSIARIITDRAQVESALQDGGKRFSSRTYGALGGRSFLLAFDPAEEDREAHAAQFDTLTRAFSHWRPTFLENVARQACEAAAVLSLRENAFDLASFAEQAALRYCQFLFGYADNDFPQLERTLRASHRALVYQVLGRHFVTDPTLIPAARTESARLLTRTAELIDAYASQDRDVLKRVKAPAAMFSAKPLLALLAADSSTLTVEQLAILAMGAAAGSVGNLKAAACIAVKSLLEHAAPSKTPEQLMADALSLNPPIPFVPRVLRRQDAQKDGVDMDVLLSLRGMSHGGHADALIWGLPATQCCPHVACPSHPPLQRCSHAPGAHWCLGIGLGQAFLRAFVGHVTALPNLAERLDPRTALPKGLTKRWGFLCESYPLTHRRDRRVAQVPLIVAMRVKSPVEQHAQRLRELIRSGAPRMKEVLSASRHVHFAWFEFTENNRMLVLHTVYDGDFAAYIQHFALQAGDLFDSLFESIADAPPMPVNEHPDEFVALVARYNQAPAMGFFFSAYPMTETAMIVREEQRQVRDNAEATP